MLFVGSVFAVNIKLEIYWIDLDDYYERPSQPWIVVKFKRIELSTTLAATKSRAESAVVAVAAAASREENAEIK